MNIQLSRFRVFFVAGAEAINKHSFRELSPAVLSAGRSLLGAVFAPLGSPGVRSSAEPGGEGLPWAGQPGRCSTLRMLPCLRAAHAMGQGTFPNYRSQEPVVGAGGRKGGRGKGPSRFCREHGRARRGSPSSCGQQSPRLCAGGLFIKGCGQTVGKFAIKTCSCSRRGFPRKDRPKSM